MSAARRDSLKAPSASSRPRAVSLQRQTSLIEPAASIVGLPEIEREPSKLSRHAPIEERRESQSSEKDDEKGEEVYVADEVTFPDGGMRVSHPLPVGRDADGLGMAMCSRSLVDCILWVWASGNNGSVSDIIPVIFLAGVFRVSRTLISGYFC
jgi:hypothetical protein